MNLQSIIERALARTEGLPNDARAARIADFIEIAQELSGDTGVRYRIPEPQIGERLISGGRVQSQQVPATNGTLVVLPDEVPDSLPRMSVSDPRMVMSSRSSEPVRSLQEIEAYVQRVAPTTMDVTIDPDSPPVRLVRRITMEKYGAGSDDEGVVKLCYADKGDIDCPPFLFTTSDANIDIQAALRECEAVAKSRYSLKKRDPIKARPVKPWTPDIESTLANGVGAEAGDSVMPIQGWDIGSLTNKGLADLGIKR